MTKFKVGDVVELVDSSRYTILEAGKPYTIVEGYVTSREPEVSISLVMRYPSDFKLVREG